MKLNLLFLLFVALSTTQAFATPTAGIRRPTILAKLAGPTGSDVVEAMTRVVPGARDEVPELASLLAFAVAAGVDFHGDGKVAPAVSLVGTVALVDVAGGPLCLGLGGGFAFPSATEHFAAGRLGLTYSLPARGAVRPGFGVFAIWDPQRGWGGNATFVLELLVVQQMLDRDLPGAVGEDLQHSTAGQSSPVSSPDS